MTKEQIENKLIALVEAKNTVSMQINELGTFYSYLQVKVWRKRRALINAKIKYYHAKLKQLDKPVARPL